MMYKSQFQKIYPCDWFSGPGSQFIVLAMYYLFNLTLFVTIWLSHNRDTDRREVRNIHMLSFLVSQALCFLSWFYVLIGLICFSCVLADMNCCILERHDRRFSLKDPLWW